MNFATVKKSKEAWIRPFGSTGLGQQSAALLARDFFLLLTDDIWENDTSLTPLQLGGAI